mmetsp:Transcript_17484/g.32756  ORF Transcript_17484/g.32756 Transcript_17484/m.32756 type:complete len:392 (-) Transcript_17484:22-1197(-)
MSRPRPDRMTYEGTVWNAEAILDRLDRAIRVDQDLPPTTRTKGSASAASGGSVSGDDDEKVAPAACPPLCRPSTECIRGVILISAVLPPFQDFVGRVGTGLVFRRTGQDSWSEPKPCSLTALASPIPDRTQKCVLDVIFFVCGDSHYKENDDWWHALSCPTGLLLEEDKSQFSKSKNDVPEEAQQDEDGDILETVLHTNGSSTGGRGRVWKAVNLANLVDSFVYPFVHQHEDHDGTTVPPSLYYYCWNKDHLLSASAVLMGRVVLMEFQTAQRSDKEPSEETCRLDTLMNHLLRQSDDKALPEVIQPDLLAGDTNGTIDDGKEPNAALAEEASQTANEALSSDPVNPCPDEVMQEDLPPPTQPETAEGEFKAIHDQDEIEGKGTFVSDEYC